LMQAIQLPFTF
nr:immunoglobulin light chain junction region [Macaca mulatta]